MRARPAGSARAGRDLRPVLAGWPRRSRHVGHVLATLPDATDLPWHRVINARGEVSARGDGIGIQEGYQRHLLEEEGVEFDERGRVDLDRYRWEPSVRVSRAKSAARDS